VTYTFCISVDNLLVFLLICLSCLRDNLLVFFEMESLRCAYPLPTAGKGTIPILAAGGGIGIIPLAAAGTVTYTFCVSVDNLLVFLLICLSCLRDNLLVFLRCAYPLPQQWR